MKIHLLFLLSCLSVSAWSQTGPSVVSTVAPSLEFYPDARIGGMADIGVVSSMVYRETGLYQNPSLLTSDRRTFSVNGTYMQMLRFLANDIRLKGVSAMYAPDSLNAFGVSIKRFSLGEINQMDEFGEIAPTLHPAEQSYKLSYARAVSKGVSLGLSLKYIDSKLDNGISYETITFRTLAADLGFSYRRNYIFSSGRYLNTNIGIALNNLGPKVTFDNSGGDENFIQTNLKTGILLNSGCPLNPKVNLNLEAACQLEKDLIPSMPVYSTTDSAVIVRGKDPDISVLRALYQSFYDSPDGVGGELKEIRIKAATELRLNYTDILYMALRTGYYTQQNSQSHITIGVGIGVYGFTLDYANSQMQGLPSSVPKDFALTLGFRANLAGPCFRF